MVTKINYSIDAKISQFEWMLLQQLRKLQEYGYGDASLKVCEGQIVDLRFAQTHSREELNQLQIPNQNI
jgi:hypothetical protein